MITEKLRPNDRAVHIIIPVHNRKHLTLNCLKNLQKHGELNHYYIIVVDDGSTDGMAEAIRVQFSSVKILQGDGNLWWTGAISLGMEYAYKQGAEYFIWLNDDCQFSDRTLTDLIDFTSTHQDSIIGCQGIEMGTSNQIAFGGKVKTWKGYRFIQPLSQMVTPCDVLSGNIVCLPRNVVQKIGYPNPKVAPHYGGDSLYLILAQKAGFSIYVDNRNSVYGISGESKLYPQNWLMGKGKALDILKLVFVPQSGLSWRIWLNINWQAYGVWGIVMFCKKYLSILLITILRFLPLELRLKLSR